MTKRIIQIMKEHQITEYCLLHRQVCTREMYFYGHTCDMLRLKECGEWSLTIYHSYMEEGLQYKGEASVKLFPDMTDREMTAAICSAAHTAGQVRTSDYPCPSAELQTELPPAEEGSRLDRMSKIFLQADSCHVLQHLEIYEEQTEIHILTSWGSDIRSRNHKYYGEFSVSDTGDHRKEVFREFSMRQPEEDIIRRLVQDAVRMADERTRKMRGLPSGTCRVLFQGHQVYELLKMYRDRAKAANVAAGYSDYRPGMTRIPAKEPVSIQLMSMEPYSREGMKMPMISLFEDGLLKNLHGTIKYTDMQSARMLPEYEGICCRPGSFSKKQLLQEPCLIPVLFSDFIMYGITGDFFGEIRLAYYYDGKNMHFVQGGSIQGNLADLHSTMKLSSEIYREWNYEGPEWLRLEGVQVMGTECPS